MSEYVGRKGPLTIVITTDGHEDVMSYDDIFDAQRTGGVQILRGLGGGQFLVSRVFTKVKVSWDFRFWRITETMFPKDLGFKKMPLAEDERLHRAAVRAALKSPLKVMWSVLLGRTTFCARRVY